MVRDTKAAVRQFCGCFSGFMRKSVLNYFVSTKIRLAFYRKK